MAGKISEYSSTRTAFAGLDLFDVSATDDAGSTYVSQKTTWTNIKAQLTSELSFLSAGDNVSALINDAGYVTSNITHTGEVTGLATLTAHPTMISNKTLVTAVATDMVLLWDATDSTLKRADVSDFLGGGGNTIYTANDSLSGNRAVALDAFDLIFESSVAPNFPLLNLDAANTRVGIAIDPTERFHVNLGALNKALIQSTSSTIIDHFKVTCSQQHSRIVSESTSSARNGKVVALNSTGEETTINSHGSSFGDVTLRRHGSLTSDRDLYFITDPAKVSPLGTYKFVWADGLNSVTERMRLDSTGLVIGSTDSFGNKLFVNGNCRVDGNYVVNGNTGFTGTGAYTNFTIEGGIVTAAS